MSEMRIAALGVLRKKIIRSHCQNPVFLIVWGYPQTPFSGAIIGEISKTPCQMLKLIQI